MTKQDIIDIMRHCLQLIEAGEHIDEDGTILTIRRQGMQEIAKKALDAYDLYIKEK